MSELLGDPALVILILLLFVLPLIIVLVPLITFIRVVTMPELKLQGNLQSLVNKKVKIEGVTRADELPLITESGAEVIYYKILTKEENRRRDLFDVFYFGWEALFATKKEEEVVSSELDYVSNFYLEAENKEKIRVHITDKTNFSFPFPTKRKEQEVYNYNPIYLKKKIADIREGYSLPIGGDIFVIGKLSHNEQGVVFIEARRISPYDENTYTHFLKKPLFICSVLFLFCLSALIFLLILYT